MSAMKNYSEADSMESLGIIYHSRMRYLKSRDGGERPALKTNSVAAYGSCPPCPPARLLPPLQLMTREHSIRHSYWKMNKLPSLPKAEFLRKKEDPETKKKRELIYARMRANELASEKYNKEAEAKRSDKYMIDDNPGKRTNQTNLSLMNSVPQI